MQQTLKQILKRKQSNNYKITSSNFYSQVKDNFTTLTKQSCTKQQQQCNPNMLVNNLHLFYIVSNPCQLRMYKIEKKIATFSTLEWIFWTFTKIN